MQYVQCLTVAKNHVNHQLMACLLLVFLVFISTEKIIIIKDILEVTEDTF